jgi:hypothetical protein
VLDPEAVASYPAPDVTVERIGDLMSYDRPALLPGRSPIAVSAKVM